VGKRNVPTELRRFRWKFFNYVTDGPECNANHILYWFFLTKGIAIYKQTNFVLFWRKVLSGWTKCCGLAMVLKVSNLTECCGLLLIAINSKCVHLPTVSQLLQGTQPSLTFSIGDFRIRWNLELDLGIQIRALRSINGGGSPYIVIRWKYLAI